MVIHGFSIVSPAGARPEALLVPVASAASARSDFSASLQDEAWMVPLENTMVLYKYCALSSVLKAWDLYMLS